ncbi:outer membrane protein assembly factor BamD [Roseivivax sediminis]|uniref:Tetratricopeptide repeat-containing protein n=1 Tax=Roseivivax sediminis TaxID=936889 RepID=A0A1I2ADE7_9RHOB|nr:hypothetical protein [Roseivivax sediminis]SFE40993.1 hypothetical protein SAMN04515678_109158 [Roseivivax sediminis]
MTLTAILRAGALGAVAFGLASCAGAPTGGSGEFRKGYTAARTALEAGRYDSAERGYMKLVPEAGALTPRIRLEYAHTLLRAEDYARARSEAQRLVVALDGQNRLAALAVQATAEHELGLVAMTAGDRDAARTLMTSARTGMTEVLANAPDLDPAGALAGRNTSLGVQLERLG